jgi:hypothetical protein
MTQQTTVERISDRELVATRRFAAPTAQVFEALDDVVAPQEPKIRA